MLSVNVRRQAGVVLVVALGLVPLLPTEHVHELTDADGHHEVVAHRHSAPHAVSMIDSERGDIVDHPDGLTLNLDDSYTAPAPYVHQLPAMPVAMVTIDPRLSVAPASRDFSAPPAHGPPRVPTGLRAPPVPLS